VVTIIFCTLAGLSFVFSQEPLIVKKLSDPIVFDGIADEEAWATVSPLKLTMHSPVFMSDPTEETVIKIAYDDEYIYVSGIYNFSDSSIIRAIGKKRDFANPNCDWLGVIFDSFNDRENGVGFFTNPNGLRSDASIKNDATLEEDINFSWNTFWDVKTIKSKNGWSAEFRIPLSSLRFQIKDGKTRMGLIIFSYLAAKPEMLTFPAISPEYQIAYWKPSLSSEIEFTGLNPVNPVYFTPYITSGLSQVSELNESESDYKLSSKPKFDAGLDVKYSLSNNLTMDLTLNTDFAQVEADDQKINLTRYSLFFPEKRIFFLEKADVFDFSFLGGNNLFYSRRIGILDGNPVRIYGGVRMTGRINKWDIGIMDMQTAPLNENPGENFGVFRTKRNILNQNSYLGGMFTTRLGMNGNYNVAYGFDAQLRVKGDDYLLIRLAQTVEKDSIKKVFDPAPSRLLFEWQRRNQKGFGYDFVYTYSGTRFNPGIGFEVKNNYQGFRAILQYGWLPKEKAAMRINKVYYTGTNFWSTATGLFETSTNILSWQFEAKKGYSGNISVTWNLEDLTDTLILGDDQSYIPPGRYSFTNLSVLYNTSYSRNISGTFTSDIGKFYDGSRFSFSALPKLSIGESIDLGLSYNLDIVKFTRERRDFTNHIFGFKGLLTLTTKSSLSAFIQYNTGIDKILTNIRFRFNPREGNDFYIVYDEGLNTRLRREIPNLSLSSGRTILLKYTYTFRFERQSRPLMEL